MSAAYFLLLSVVFAIDNGDGTYSNPVIHADYPDCEIIRVEDDCYFISTTFHFVPGNPILHSKDPVNWKQIGHAIPAYSWDGRYNLQDGQNRYGAGSWAPTFRHHKGMFYHACYVWTDGGKGVFMITRSNSIEEIRGSSLANPDRHTRAQIVNWKRDGTPDLGVPVPDGTYYLPKHKLN